MTTIKSFSAVLAFTIGLLFALVSSVYAQSSTDYNLADTLSSDSISLRAIVAFYRDDVRQSVLRVSQYPQVLTQLAQQQIRSQQAFDAYIQQYGKTRKGWFYDITRFPNALHALAILPPDADKSMGRAITQTLPPASQRSAWKLYRHHNLYLVLVDSVSQRAERLFESLITPLTPPIQASFRQLLRLPDLLELLTQQIAQTTKLGRAYQADSAATIQQLAVLHDSLTTQNQRELADYKRELSQDPLAQQELFLAGQDYAQNNGYKARPNTDSTWADSLTYYQNQYSYWFGYPSWYSSPLGYPLTGLYGTGIGYGPNGYLTVFGYPSINFTNWLFTRGYQTYPHLCDRFYAYYGHMTIRHRHWTPRNSGFLLATHRQFYTRDNSWNNSSSSWLTGSRHYYHTTNVTGSNVTTWTSSPHRHYSTPSHAYHAPSRSWSSGSTHTHSSGSGSHHSSSSHSSGHSGGYHGGSSHSRGPR